MTSLLHFQRDFAARLLDQPNHMADQVAIPVGWSSEQAVSRLQIYRNNFVITLQEILQLAYPVTQQLLGEESFNQQTRRFVMSHPLKQADVSVFGEGFSSALLPLAKQFNLSYLVELADLEWQFYQSGQGPTVTRQLVPADLANLTEQEQSSLKLLLHPGIKLCHYQQDVFSLHQRIREKQFDALNSLQLDKPVWLALVRQSIDRVAAHPLNNEQYDLLVALQHTPALAQLVENHEPGLLAPLGQLLNLPLFSHYEIQA